MRPVPRAGRGSWSAYPGRFGSLASADVRDGPDGGEDSMGGNRPGAGQHEGAPLPRLQTDDQSSLTTREKV